MTRFKTPLLNKIERRAHPLTFGQKKDKPVRNIVRNSQNGFRMDSVRSRKHLVRSRKHFLDFGSAIHILDLALI